MTPHVILLSLALVGSAAFGAGQPVIKLRPSVERTVSSVLRASAAMRAANDSEETWRAFDRALDPLLEKPTRTSDEALVALLSFYIGEHPSEDLTCELVSRGRRVKAFLKVVRDHEVRVSVPAKRLAHRAVEPIASGHGFKILDRLNREYGKTNWRKLKGIAAVRLPDGTIADAEVHWFEGHGIGKRRMKVKRLIR